MKVSKVAKAIGISVSTIRRWEKYLKLEIPRDKNGDRFYSEEWVTFFQKVHELNQAGKDFDEIQTIVTPPAGKKPEPVPQIPDEKLNELCEELKQLSTSIENVRSNITSLSDRLNKEDNKHSDFNDSLKLLSKKLDGLSSVQEGLRSQIDQSNEEVKGLSKVDDNLRSEINRLSDLVKGLSQKKGNPDDLANEVTGLSEDLKGLSDKLNSLEIPLKGLPDRISGIEKKLKGLSDSGSEFEKLKNKFWVYITIAFFAALVVGAGLMNFATSK